MGKAKNRGFRNDLGGGLTRKGYETKAGDTLLPHAQRIKQTKGQLHPHARRVAHAITSGAMPCFVKYGKSYYPCTDAGKLFAFLGHNLPDFSRAHPTINGTIRYASEAVRKKWRSLVLSEKVYRTLRSYVERRKKEKDNELHETANR